MQGMIMHHSQAVEMTALISSHTENKEIRTLGARISLSQTDEIKFMKRWLVARRAPLSMAMSAMPGMDNSDPSMPGDPVAGFTPANATASAPSPKPISDTGFSSNASSW
jgi:uncharacterized protein (DUF305 family)